MKKTIIAAMVSLGMGSLVLAQTIKKGNENQSVPLVVEQAFQKQYPGVKHKWEKEGNKYEAEFKFQNHEMSSLYETNGALVETEVEISVKELPAEVTRYVAEHHLGKIKEASKITKADGSVEYEAEVKGGDAIFDSKGSFLNLKKD